MLRRRLTARCHRAFNACRVPASPSDYGVKTAENAPEAQHMVVVRKNRFYSLPLVDNNGRQFTVEEFRRCVCNLHSCWNVR